MTDGLTGDGSEESYRVSQSKEKATPWCSRIYGREVRYNHYEKNPANGDHQFRLEKPHYI
jgi:hypothetical protein